MNVYINQYHSIQNKNKSYLHCERETLSTIARTIKTVIIMLINQYIIEYMVDRFMVILILNQVLSIDVLLLFWANEVKPKYFGLK